MSKNARQNHHNQQSQKQEEKELTPQERYEEAKEKLAATPSKEGIETPSFVKDAQVQEEVVKEEYKAEVKVETIPDHVQEAKQKTAPSHVVDLVTLRTRLSTSGNLCLEAFLKYMQDMAPNKPMSEQEGARYQANFWSALDTLFNRLDDSDFNELYRALLQLFEEHKEGVFSDERVYRFVEHWPMSEVHSAAMKRILNLMLVTRNPATRHRSVQDLKNWGYILEFGLTDQARNRIRNFYNL